MKNRNSKRKIEFFTDLIRHIDETWKDKKKLPYPFIPRDFKELGHVCRYYQPWGIMALWDIYISTESTYSKTIHSFVHSLPYLVDQPHWRGSAKIYENKLISENPKVLELFDLKKANDLGPPGDGKFVA